MGMFDIPIIHFGCQLLLSPLNLDHTGEWLRLPCKKPSMISSQAGRFPTPDSARLCEPPLILQEPLPAVLLSNKLPKNLQTFGAKLVCTSALHMCICKKASKFWDSGSILLPTTSVRVFPPGGGPAPFSHQISFFGFPDLHDLGLDPEISYLGVPKKLGPNLNLWSDGGSKKDGFFSAFSHFQKKTSLDLFGCLEFLN